MVVTAWHLQDFNVVDVDYFLKFQTRSSGIALSGQSQVAATGASHWQVRIGLSFDGDETAVKMFEALTASAQGRSSVIRLPLLDPYAFDSGVSPRQEPFSDGTWFGDDTGFLATGTHPVDVASEAPIGATSLTVNLSGPSRPHFRVGDYFSFDDFLYRVTDANSSGAVRFLPRLRSTIPSGAVLETDPPHIRVRFASDDEGRRKRKLGRFGIPITLNFVEAFER